MCPDTSYFKGKASAQIEENSQGKSKSREGIEALGEGWATTTMAATMG